MKNTALVSVVLPADESDDLSEPVLVEAWDRGALFLTHERGDIRKQECVALNRQQVEALLPALQKFLEAP